MSKTTDRKPILCIVKSSAIIKKKLTERFAELENLSYGDVSRDAKKRGMKIAVSSLSRYFGKKPHVRSGLSQENILWLCIRYCINVQLKIKVKSFDQETADTNLAKYFPNKDENTSN